ncbi:hypothetical protein Taro_051676 [Colocasia esculenta]|uniref:Ubiquitin-like domain-containing protein n=1 Tax=Colocasia esculenta TaxID=4460 RepID=A0A843XGL1_COLES|nr:hypothetical protein [Colocasia esculenta]
MSGNPPQEEDKKPAEQSAHINLKVKGQKSIDLRVVFGFQLMINCVDEAQCEDLAFSGFASEMLFSLFGDGNEVFFRIKRSTQLRKLMNAYCDRQSVDFNSIAFLFDGRRLRGEQTPDELEMEDGDEIDAMLHQTGGGPNVA